MLMHMHKHNSQGGVQVSPKLSIAILKSSPPDFDFTSYLDKLAYDASPEQATERWLRRYRTQNLSNIDRGLVKAKLAAKYGIATMMGTLRMRLIRKDGDILDYGLISTRVVTTAGVNFLVDALQGTVEPEILRYHGIGTGGAAEAVGNTGLTTELTTEYTTNNTRGTGTLTEGASANIFRTVGSNPVDATVAITEHGVFSQAATGGGTMLDRSLFAAVNGVSGDTYESTYEFTITAGG
jgi:hypothetical protein